MVKFPEFGEYNVMLSVVFGWAGVWFFFGGGGWGEKDELPEKRLRGRLEFVQPTFVETPIALWSMIAHWKLSTQKSDSKAWSTTGQPSNKLERLFLNKSQYIDHTKLTYSLDLMRLDLHCLRTR